jgi:hypothetical protein
MAWFDVPGPELALLTRVTHSVDGDLAAAELALLNRPLAHEGGERPLKRGVRMSGQYELAFDTTPYTIPPADETYLTQGWWIEAVAFHVTRDLATARANGLAYDPIPTNETMDKRVRFTRVIGGIHVTWSIDNNTAIGTLTLPELEVVRLGGRVYGWRDWWQECELD